MSFNVMSSSFDLSRTSLLTSSKVAPFAHADSQAASRALHWPEIREVCPRLKPWAGSEQARGGSAVLLQKLGRLRRRVRDWPVHVDSGCDPFRDGILRVCERLSGGVAVRHATGQVGDRSEIAPVRRRKRAKQNRVIRWNSLTSVAHGSSLMIPCPFGRPLDMVVAAMVPAIDQDVADAGGAQFAESDFAGRGDMVQSNCNLTRTAGCLRQAKPVQLSRIGLIYRLFLVSAEGLEPSTP
jgi:hypothetical protein